MTRPAIAIHGGLAADAVEAGIVVMEDPPQFNAGHGAALNAGGIHELDVSIMRGADLGAGAVGPVRRIRNPIRAARTLLEQGSQVVLGGAEADKFAARSGLDMVEQFYFTTQRRVQVLDSFKAKPVEGTLKSATEAEKHGTVGAVALDSAAHLADGTSTGGYNDKPEGRIGDSPIIGAGTYARDGVSAVSGTGAGEFFIRHTVGHEIASRIAYLGDPLVTAADQVIKTDLASYGIGAGIVAVDAHGNITAPFFNADGVFRGLIDADGNLFVGTHAEVSAVPL